MSPKKALTDLIRSNRPYPGVLKAVLVNPTDQVTSIVVTCFEMTIVHP